MANMISRKKKNCRKKKTKLNSADCLLPGMLARMSSAPMYEHIRSVEGSQTQFSFTPPLERFNTRREDYGQTEQDGGS